MNYYESLVGSRSNNIHLPTSDYDYFVCADDKKEALYYVEEQSIPSHLIYHHPSRFFYNVFLDIRASFNIQYFFPAKIIKQTQVMDYLVKNREKILEANSEKIYNTFLNFCSYVKNLSPEDRRYVKKFVYANLYANLLIGYGLKERSFEELFVVSGDWREYLLSIRQGGEVTKEHYNNFLEKYNCLSKLEEIYQKRQNNVYLSQAREDVKQLLNISK